MKLFTDYPILELGDKEGCVAPLRQVEVLAYDLDKYCQVLVEGVIVEFKAGYVYRSGRKKYIPFKTWERWVESGKIRELVWG